MAHDGLCGVTSGSPSCAETQLTATLGQLTPFDGSPVRVAGLARARARVCAMERGREKMCVSVSPGEPPRPDGVSDGTLITQPSKRAVLRRSDWRGGGCVVVREVAFGEKQSGVGGGAHVELSVSNTGEQSWRDPRLSHRLPSWFGLLHHGII